MASEQHLYQPQLEGGYTYDNIPQEMLDYIAANNYSTKGTPWESMDHFGTGEYRPLTVDMILFGPRNEFSWPNPPVSSENYNASWWGDPTYDAEWYTKKREEAQYRLNNRIDGASLWDWNQGDVKEKKSLSEAVKDYIPDVVEEFELKHIAPATQAAALLTGYGTKLYDYLNPYYHTEKTGHQLTMDAYNTYLNKQNYADLEGGMSRLPTIGEGLSALGWVLDEGGTSEFIDDLGAITGTEIFTDYLTDNLRDVIDHGDDFDASKGFISGKQDIGSINIVDATEAGLSLYAATKLATAGSNLYSKLKPYSPLTTSFWARQGLKPWQATGLSNATFFTGLSAMLPELRSKYQSDFMPFINKYFMDVGYDVDIASTVDPQARVNELFEQFNIDPKSAEGKAFLNIWNLSGRPVINLGGEISPIGDWWGAKGSGASAYIATGNNPSIVLDPNIENIDNAYIRAIKRAQGDIGKLSRYMQGLLGKDYSMPDITKEGWETQVNKDLFFNIVYTELLHQYQMTDLPWNKTQRRFWNSVLEGTTLDQDEQYGRGDFRHRLEAGGPQTFESIHNMYNPTLFGASHNVAAQTEQFFLNNPTVGVFDYVNPALANLKADIRLEGAGDIPFLPRVLNQAGELVEKGINMQIDPRVKEENEIDINIGKTTSDYFEPEKNDNSGTTAPHPLDEFNILR